MVCLQADMLSDRALAAESSDQSIVREVILPTVLLVDQDRHAQRLDRLVDGRTVVINFVFTSCKTSCSILSTIMAQVEKAVLDRLGQELVLVSLTVDPAQDTPEQLKRYAERFATTPHWFWLTGSVPDVKQALRAFSIPTLGKPDDHPPIIMAGNVRTGKWRRWVGIPDPQVIAQVVHELSHE